MKKYHSRRFFSTLLCFAFGSLSTSVKGAAVKSSKVRPLPFFAKKIGSEEYGLFFFGILDDGKQTLGSLDFRNKIKNILDNEGYSSTPEEVYVVVNDSLNLKFGYPIFIFFLKKLNDQSLNNFSFKKISVPNLLPHSESIHIIDIPEGKRTVTKANTEHFGAHIRYAFSEANGSDLSLETLVHDQIIKPTTEYDTYCKGNEYTFKKSFDKLQAGRIIYFNTTLEKPLVTFNDIVDPVVPLAVPAVPAVPAPSVPVDSVSVDRQFEFYVILVVGLVVAVGALLWGGARYFLTRKRNKRWHDRKARSQAKYQEEERGE